MKKIALIAGCLMGTAALTACDVKANEAATGLVYQAQAEDKGVSSRCARIVNPEERRKCIQSSG